jgi:hypothetical protein
MNKEPKVQFFREDEECSEVTLRFNEPALKLIQSRSFNIEDYPKGILITFPSVDSYNSFKVTNKKREIEAESESDAKSGWYPMTEEANGYYLIDLYVNESTER